jgi:MarR family transcriptional regulator, organic hydroperoxide resistance regulator
MFDECIYFNLAAVNRQIGRIWNDAYQQLGLSPSHAYLLAAVIASGDDSQNALSEIMALEASTIARFAEDLEKRGLVERQRQGRTVHVRATLEGQRIGQSVYRAMELLYQRMQRRLGNARFKSLVDQLNAVRTMLMETEA